MSRPRFRWVFRMIRYSRIRLVVLSLSILGALSVLGGCKSRHDEGISRSEGAAERTGRRIDEAADDMKARLGDASEEAGKTVDRALEDLDGLTDDLAEEIDSATDEIEARASRAADAAADAVADVRERAQRAARELAATPRR